jgi:arsenate reductase
VTTRPTVLFVCVHNAGRSQMAAGYLHHLAGDRIQVLSAGSHPADRLNPVAVAAMAEEGIDIAAESPQLLTDSAVQEADVVVTMGCGDECPFFPGKRYEDWVLDDPAGQDIEVVRPIRDEIRRRVEGLVDELVGVSLQPVTAANWRDVADVRPDDAQRAWVADVTYYLCLSAYGDVWRSCAVVSGGETVGHVMWGVDPEDDSHWVGGLVIDRRHQRRGLGRATVRALLTMFESEPSLSGTAYTQAVLSVESDNEVARSLYRSLGFAETGELSYGELVMRRPRTG